MTPEERLNAQLRERAERSKPSIVFDVLLRIEHKKLLKSLIKLWPFPLLIAVSVAWETIHLMMPTTFPLPPGAFAFICVVGTAVAVAYLSR
jgi:hypothetical protein